MSPAINSEETRTVFSPTLLIGLGGTGSEILLDVRERVLKNNQGVLNKFLFVDTDIKTASGKKGYSDLDNNEICMVGMRSAKSYLANLKHRKGLTDRFPPDKLTPEYVSLLSQGTGAAQIRSLGALAFALDYTNIRKRVESSIDQLTKAQNRQQAKANQRGITIKKESIIVYIVGSIVGGTGSGSFVDAAAVARDVIDYSIGWETTVIGVFTLPDGYDEEVRNDKTQRENIRANAYASLQELQFLSDRDYDNIPFVYGDNMKIDLDSTRPLFNNMYVIDNRNTTGSVTLDDIYQLVASSIYQDIGTPFGANSQSAQINMGIFNGLAPDPKSGKKRLFSSLAASSLVYPAKRVAEYCTCNCLSEVVSDELLGSSPGLQSIKDEVDSFLKNNQLEEREPSNQIINSLLKRAKGSFSSHSVGLDPMQVEVNGDIEESIDMIESERHHIDSVVRNDVLEHSEENKKLLIYGDEGGDTSVLRDKVEKWAIRMAVSHNMNTALRALERLVNVSQAMSSELKREQQEWTERNRSYNEDINGYLSDLRDVGWFNRRMGKHKPIIQNAIDRFNEFVDAKLESWVKADAIEVVGHLEEISSDLHAKWMNCIHALDVVQQEASQDALLLETGKSRRGVSRFATEIEVTDPGYESSYFKENYLPPREIYNGLISQHSVESDDSPGSTDEEALLSWIFEISERQDGIETMSDHMRSMIMERFWKGLLDTNIIDFIQNNAEDVSEFIDDKLAMMFEMCSPFWQLGPQMLSSIQLPETFCVSVKFVPDDNGEFKPPKEVEDWINRYEETGAKGQILNSHEPYKISVNRRVHGARAYFLSSTPRWEQIYRSKKRQAENKFMLHVHNELDKLPDLAPRDDESLLAFAKGMALGLIVKRGDWYYYGLEHKYDVSSDTDYLQIGYCGHWNTLHTLDDVPPVPEKCGTLWFRLQDKNPPEELRIAQGRERAVKALERKGEWVKQINEAFDDYYKNVGMGLREQLGKYLEEVLTPACRKATGSNKEILQKEIDALTDWARNAN